MPLIIDPKTGLPFPRRTDRAPRRGRKAIRIPGPADIDQVPAGVARDPGLDVDPKAFGSGVGEAVADFGQAVARLASPVDRMNRRNDEAFAAAGLAALHERQTRASLEARKDTGGGVAGFHDGRMAAFDRDLGEVLERAPSTVAREILKSQGAALRDLMSGGAARFEATARIVERRANLDRELGNLSALARQDPDDHALHRALLENLLGAASNELAADKMAPFRAAEERRLAEASVRGFIDRGDVPSARALLEAVGQDGPAGEAAPLSPEKAGALRRDIERTADEARRAERRAVDALMEDHLASIQTTGAGLGGIAGRARAALDGKAFTAFQRDEKDAHAFHETMKSLKFARPEVIGRELESRRPKPGARNFADRQRRFRVLERGAKQMLNLRARDGAAFVMEMEDVKAAVEGAGADGPDLRRALKFRMAMQADIGMPEDRVRLLTRAEAGALAGQVQSARPEDRAAKVAGLQDLYGPLFGRAMTELSDEGLDPRYRALAGARDNPALARTIARALEPGGAGPEQALDPGGSQEVRGRVHDLTADARPDAEPGGEMADGIDAIVSAAEALGVEYLRQSGRVEESAARAAAFANGAIEEMRLATAGDGAVDAGDGGEKRSGGDGPEPRAGPNDDTPEDGAPRGSGPDADVVPSARKLGTDGLSGVQKRRVADAKAEFDKLEGLRPGSPGFQRARERLSRLQQRLTKTERLELVRQVIADIPLRGLAGRGTDRLLADGQLNRPTGELRRPSFRSEFVENTLLGQLTLKPLGDAIAGLRGMAGLDPVNPFSGRILSKKEVQETNVLTLVGAGTAGAGRLATLARNIPAPRSLGNVKVRKWYHQQLDAIPDALDGSRPLDVRAKLAQRLRREAIEVTREAMVDRNSVAELPPPRSFEEMIEKARARGLEGDGIWKYIIEAAKRSNPDIDKLLGITRNK